MKFRGIQSKLLIGFGCVVSIVALQGIFEHVRFRQIQGLLNESCRSSFNEVKSAESMLKSVMKIRLALSGDQAIPDSRKAEIGKEVIRLRSSYEQALSAARTAREAGLRRGARNDEAHLKKLGDAISRLESAWGAQEKSAVPLDSLGSLLGLLDQTIFPMVSAYGEQSDQDMSNEAVLAQRILARSHYYFLAAAGVAVLASIIASFLLSRMILEPLAKTTATAQEIAQGDLSRRMSLKRRDEFGLLAKTFNQMLDSLQSTMVTRDQLETTVTERTRELNQFFTLSLDLLCIADFSGKFIRVNQAFQETLGYSEEELLARPFFDFIHPDDLAATAAEMEKYRSMGSPTLHLENRYRHKDGSWRQLSWKAVPMTDTGLIYATARDVTELRLSEERLRASEEYNRSIVQSTEDCLKILTLGGHLLSIGEPGLKLLEIEDFEKVRNTDWTSLWKDSDRKAAIRAVESARAGGTGRFQGFCPTFRGTPKWWDVIVSPINSPTGEPVRLLAVSRDITKQKEIEDELRDLNATLEQRAEARTAELVANENRFRLLVEAVEDYAIFMLDPTGAVATWNSGAQRTKGYTADEILGRNFSCFYTPEDIRAKLPERLLLEATRDGSVTNEGWRVRKDGSRFWADVDITVIRDKAGHLQGFAKITRDLTEWRKAESALREALETQRELTRKAQAGENAKSDFLAVMSHEVRTPMNGIIGYADLLANAPELSSENREYAQTLYQSGRALLRILDDILDFSSSEKGSLKIEKEPFSPAQLLGDVRLLFAPTAAEKGLALLVEIAPELPKTLIGDPGRLRQILLNLVGNAVKFTPSGSVTIRADRSEEMSRTLWEFSVRDTGIGVEKAHRDTIFEPFVQGETGTSRRYGGTGLGLAISKRLAELQGGTIALRDNGGTGAEFVVRMPLEVFQGEADKPAADGPVADEKFALSHPLEILVVEDERINLRLTLTLLRKLGYEPLAAVNGIEAVEIYRSKKPTCILMDIQMPEMDGIEATQAIRKLEQQNGCKPTFIAALTANTDAQDRERCFEAGMSDYLNKPIRRERVCQILMTASGVAAA